MFIPDVTYFPACYVDDLTITNLGNTRTLNLGGGAKVVPEAYRFSINFKSLTEESRNIFGGVDGSEQLEVISTNPDGAFGQIGGAIGGAIDSFTGD